MSDDHEQILKLRFQLKQLSHALLDSKEYPLESLIIYLNWGEADLEAVHGIFEEYEKRIIDNNQPVLLHFEKQIRGRFNIGYQDVKQIILAFWRCNLWIKVCEEYARQSRASEFREILDAMENEHNQVIELETIQEQ